MDLSNRQGRREQGLRIQTAVERAGISIEELAGRLGCSRALIYQYLSGATLAQPDRLQQISAECGVPLTYFYSETAEFAPISANESDAKPAPITQQDMTSKINDSLRSLQDLAESQAGPPDYRALASTCERILSYATQIGDRPLQARSQTRLGTALLHLAEFPKAADALTQAVALCLETGAKESEISARQNLGNALSQMGRASEAEEQFALIANGTDFSGRWQGTLSLGGIHELRGEYKKAMQRFDEAAVILEEAEAQGTASPKEIASGQLYVNTNRRNVYLNGGDFAIARTLAEKGVSDAESQGNAEQHLEARFDLALCDLFTGRWASAYRSLSTTLSLARFVGDQGRETMARALLGILLAAAGDHNAAASFGKDALAQALSRGDRRSELHAQLALADAYLGQARRESEARYHVSQALAVSTSLRHDRDESESRLRQARLCAAYGELTELKEAATRALTLSVRLGSAHLESLSRCWIAESYRRQGDEISLASGLEEARKALQIAEKIDLNEAKWRANSLIAFLSPPESFKQAETHLRASISVLEALRSSLVEASLPDTILEDEERTEVYARLVRLLAGQNRREEARAFLELTGWPPLTVKINAELFPDTAQTR